MTTDNTHDERDFEMDALQDEVTRLRAELNSEALLVTRYKRERDEARTNARQLGDRLEELSARLATVEREREEARREVRAMHEARALSGAVVHVQTETPTAAMKELERLCNEARQVANENGERHEASKAMWLKTVAERDAATKRAEEAERERDEALEYASKGACCVDVEAERDTLRTQLAATSGALERARGALKGLMNESLAFMSMVPEHVRDHCIGYTNVRCMEHRLEESRAALAEPAPAPKETLPPTLERVRLAVVNALGAQVGAHASQVASDAFAEATAAPTSGPGEALEGIGELLTAVQPHLECFKTGAPAPSPTCVGGPGSEAPCSTCLIAEEVAAQLRALAGTPDATKEETT